MHVGRQPPTEIRITVLDFRKREVRERDCSVEEPARKYQVACDPAMITWINVVGIHDASVVFSLGELLALHPLTREDIMNAAQRPKAEDFEHYRFITLKCSSSGKLAAGSTSSR